MPNSPSQESTKAMANGQWKEARQLLEQQLQQYPSAEIFEELARACWWLNDFTAVFAHRAKAYESFLDKNDPHGAARNAGWLGMDYLDFKGEFAIANGWFQRAVNLVSDDHDSWELAFVKIIKARLAFMLEKTNENALRFVQESLEISKRVGSVDGEMMATGFKGFVFITEGKINEGMALLDEATLIATTAKIKDVNLATITCCFLIDACERIRDFERAGQWCNKVKEICHRWHFDAMFASCRTQYASVLIWKGDWEQAEQELLASIKELKQLRPTEIGLSLVRLAELRTKQGKWKETDLLLAQVESHALKLLASATLAFDKGEWETAADAAERFLRQIPEKENTKKIAVLELLLRIYVKQQRLEEASNIFHQLKESAEAIDTLPLKAAVLCGSGILSLCSGDFLKARQNLQDAVDLFDAIKAPLESAHARIVFAELLIKLQQYRNAESELNLALKQLKKMGAEKDMDRCRHLLKSVRKSHTAPEAIKDVCEFTGRELEILRLIAEGKNNEEIAEQLFLSVRTVEKHITNLYLKMGVYGKSARAFAASYAIKHKLVFN
jgi:DNA-binding CsgD family transcriptional regulator